MVEDSDSIGIVGLGYWGKNILRNLYEMGVLKVACDSDENSIATLKDNYKNLPFKTSVRDLLNEPSFRAIAIATPAATHYQIVKEALLAGKDVLVEKPLALSIREGEELVQLAEENKRILNPVLDKAKNIHRRYWKI